jgi:hypothetical protein
LGRALYNVSCDATDATQLGWSFDRARSALIAPGGNESAPLCVDTQAADNRQLWSAPCEPHPQHGAPQRFAWGGKPDEDGFAALEAMQQKKNIAVPGAQVSLSLSDYASLLLFICRFVWMYGRLYERADIIRYFSWQNSVGFARSNVHAGAALFRVGHGGGSQLEVRAGGGAPVWCIATRALNPVRDAARTYELWSKPLGGGRVAALLVNNGPRTDRVSFDPFSDCPGPPGRLSAPSVFLCKSVLYGVFVWARRALNSQKRRFPARAVADRLGGAKELRVRDVWAHADVAGVLRPGAGYTATLAPHASALIVLAKAV